MNIIFSLILIYYLNHLQFTFDWIKKIAWNVINYLNIVNKYKHVLNFNTDYDMLLVDWEKNLKGKG